MAAARGRLGQTGGTIKKREIRPAEGAIKGSMKNDGQTARSLEGGYKSGSARKGR